jgi:uncharacterized protein YndB with AHSA1/START domain
MSEKFDLTFERKTSLSPEQIWKGWTDPETLMKWFCPRPWKVIDCRIDLKASGEFFTVMQSPEGQSFPNNGCFLEVIPNQKLVWTNMMTSGFRPSAADKMGFYFTATLTLSKVGNETLYKAIVSHADKEGMQKHEQMGFQEGWGLAFDQLVELYK